MLQPLPTVPEISTALDLNPTFWGVVAIMVLIVGAFIVLWRFWLHPWIKTQGIQPDDAERLVKTGAEISREAMKNGARIARGERPEDDGPESRD